MMGMERVIRYADKKKPPRRRGLFTLDDFGILLNWLNTVGKILNNLAYTNSALNHSARARGVLGANHSRRHLAHSNRTGDHRHCRASACAAHACCAGRGWGEIGVCAFAGQARFAHCGELHQLAIGRGHKAGRTRCFRGRRLHHRRARSRRSIGTTDRRDRSRDQAGSSQDCKEGGSHEFNSDNAN
jgi:hypothetical protein